MMSVREAEGRLALLQIYRLLQSVRGGDKVQIEKMVKLGVDDLINLAEPGDGTGVLHVAVPAKNQDLVSFLLSLGANPNIQDKKGRTPAMLAAELGNAAVLELLAQSQADLSLLDAEGKGILFYCIYPTKSHARCLQAALRSHADVNNVSNQGTPVFQLMCAKECTSLCLLTLAAGADPNATDQKTGVTALMAAAKSGSLRLVRAILKTGGNPNVLDRKRLAAAHYAAMGGFFQVIQVLSAYSADMGAIDLEGRTPLHYAAAAGDADCCRFLAQRGCNPKLKNQDALLPRHIAKDAGHKAAAKELRKAERQHGKGGLVSDPWSLTLHDWSQEHETELRRAFRTERDAVTAETFVSVLEELDAPVERQQIQTVISAHAKGKEGCVDIDEFIRGVKYVKKAFLLSSYVPKKKKGERAGKGGRKKGRFVLPVPVCTVPPELTPRRPDGGPPRFMIETYYNRSDARRFDHPPAHPIVNDSGWYLEKPEKIFVNINYCVKSGDLASLDLAFSRGLPVDVHDQLYKTPLMAACSSGSYEVAQYLLRRGADVNARDQFFWTPLHHAAHAGQVEIVELLVEAGAAVDARALGGGTPLMRAIESSRPCCVDALMKAGASVNAENKKGKSCLDIARAFADSRIIELVKDRMDAPREAAKRKDNKSQKPKSAKEKVKELLLCSNYGFLLQLQKSKLAADSQQSSTLARTRPPKGPQSVVLQSSRIAAGRSSAVDVTFVPKTVWGKPPTTSQLMSHIERRKELLTLEEDFDDFTRK